MKPNASPDKAKIQAGLEEDPAVQSEEPYILDATMAYEEPQRVEMLDSRGEEVFGDGPMQAYSLKIVARVELALPGLEQGCWERICLLRDQILD